MIIDEEKISVSGYIWRERPHNEREATTIAQRLELPEIMGRIIASRNIAPENAASYLNPTIREFLPDPFHLKDMEKAASKIFYTLFPPPLEGGVRGGSSKIAIFGDYDVDGATSSALLVRYFRMLGIEPLVYIPDRIKEGYGPNINALIKLKEQGASLVITVDCGTMSFEPLKAAKEAGIEVIVIDHHKGDAEMPLGYAIVNPNRYDEESPHKQLAACGVVFLLLVAINKYLREAEISPPDLMQLLDIVALGTVCDVVPLVGINRALVAQGSKVMSQRRNIGIAALQDVALMNEKPTAFHLGYILGPRINAGGRVGKSDLGVRLLTTNDEIEAKQIASELNQFNLERRAIEAMVQEEAMQQAESLSSSDAVIVVVGVGWHAGVIGIVAGRLKEHFGKPTAVIALDNGIGKASARSITGIDLGAAVIAATHKGILAQGGGHAMAAGFTINEEKIADLRQFFNDNLQQDVLRITSQKILNIDGTISIRGLNSELVNLLDKVAPFGAGNSSVRLVINKVKVVRADILAGEHVRAIIADAGNSSGSASVKAMAFRSVNNEIGQALLNARGRTLNIAGKAKINLWQGRESVDFIIDDVVFD
ncbi:MAG: single-stranded-DNA-specific exonuclease RecJ [Pseudomonadota bacterium]